MSAPNVMEKGPLHSWYDASTAPVFVVRLPGRFSDRELAAAIHAVSHWLLTEVDALFGFIVDMQRPFAVTASQRHMMADAEKRYADVDRRFNAGQAVVVGGPLSRGIVTAIYWMAPPVYPYSIVGSMEDAYAWLRPQFARFAAQYPQGRTPPAAASA